MSTDQYSCEAIQIAMLALQTDLAAMNTAGGIVHFSKSTQTSAATIDRIVVQAMPREDEVMGYNPQNPVLKSCMVKVTLYMVTNDTALFDTYIAAIEAANVGSTPASITTLATSLFGARLFTWHDTEEQERDDTPNQRMFSKSWRALFGA